MGKNETHGPAARYRACSEQRSGHATIHLTDLLVTCHPDGLSPLACLRNLIPAASLASIELPSCIGDGGRLGDLPEAYQGAEPLTKRPVPRTASPSKHWSVKCLADGPSRRMAAALAASFMRKRLEPVPSGIVKRVEQAAHLLPDLDDAQGKGMTGAVAVFANLSRLSQCGSATLQCRSKGLAKLRRLPALAWWRR